ncbi:hypothetical protein B1H18_01985 [Streptomyces tsukubensis]|uniref:Intradiol ring-cleavage dioxygenases domain-containing protein n=1 Tax=Streptomyces tsukubensis TaxID=83656 RepID=A0A1V4AFL6_9ACTN|nr:hypothetical protein B1H18_01985 [Streptomyces tsukubensis]
MTRRPSSRQDRSSASPCPTTTSPAGEPLGERITVQGRVRDREGRPVRGQLVETWQANASGPVRTPTRPASGAARPPLHRRGEMTGRQPPRRRWQSAEPCSATP